MSYESNLLTTGPVFTLIPGSYVFSSGLSGLSASFTVSISGSVLGNNLPDEDAKLFLQASYSPSTSTVYPLSATTPTSVYLSLSSATAISTPIQYTGVILGSTFNTGISSTTIAINFPPSVDPDNVNLQNTTIYLSGNAATIAVDSTKSTTLDNFFFVSTNPAETGTNKPNTVRTTSGHARLVAALG